AHAFQAPDRPASEPLVLFELRKARLDDFTALLPLLARQGLLQSLAHGLDHRLMWPHFNLSAFGVPRAVFPHRTLPMMAAKAFHALIVFGGLAFVIQGSSLWTDDGVGNRINAEALCGVGVVFDGFAFGRGCQHLELLVQGGLQVGPAA